MRQANRNNVTQLKMADPIYDTPLVMLLGAAKSRGYSLHKPLLLFLCYRSATFVIDIFIKLAEPNFSVGITQHFWNLTSSQILSGKINFLFL